MVFQMCANLSDDAYFARKKQIFKLKGIICFHEIKYMNLNAQGIYDTIKGIINAVDLL